MKKLSQQEWVERAKIFHKNKFNYSLVEYKNAHTKVKIICPIHGVFEQDSNDHIRKAGCLKCKYENHYKKTGKSKKDFIDESNKIHENKYIYDNVEYKNIMNKVCIVCPEHGEFWQTPNKHLLGRGCPTCKQSKGEREIRKLLNKMKINFISQKTFKNCKNKNVLPFDFYIPSKRICIEYQGEQHYKPKDCFGGLDSFKRLKKNDKIKKKFCKENHINFLEISFKENIKTKLEKSICHLMNT